MTATGTNSGFGKQLADSEKKVRDRAVRGLVKWLVSNENVDDLQLMKLWKGLFYSFWMSDKPMIQEHLADKLAGLLLKLPQGNAMRYIKAFWTIMVTEWHGIDRLRLDKFYMLLRKFHFYGFQYLEGKQWAEESVREYTRILSDGPLRVNDLKVPDGLRYHTAEVYLEELQRAVGSKIPSETLLLLIEPFFHNLTRSASDVVFARASENVFERILAQKTRDDDAAEQSLVLPFDHVELGRRLFDIAIGSDVLVKNRPKVADLFKKFAKLVEIDVDQSLLKVSKPSGMKSLTKPGAVTNPGKETPIDSMDVDDRESEEVTAVSNDTDETSLKRKATEEENPIKRKKKKTTKAKKAGETATSKEVVEETVASPNGKELESEAEVTIEDILSQTAQDDVMEISNEIPAEATMTPSRKKQNKMGAKTQPNKKKNNLIVMNADSDPTHKKAVKFVLDQNMTKSFFKRLPVADEGTPTRKTNTAAKKVLKPTPPTPLTKKVAMALARSTALGKEVTKTTIVATQHETETHVDETSATTVEQATTSTVSVRTSKPTPKKQSPSAGEPVSTKKNNATPKAVKSPKATKSPASPASKRRAVASDLI